MENYLFRAAMPYCVDIDDKRIVVRNNRYKILFEGWFHNHLPLPTDVFNHISKDIADYCNPGEFSVNGGRFYLYDEHPIGEKGINRGLLNQYFERLACLLDLCDGLNCSFEENLLLFCHIEPNIYVKDLEERIKEKDAQVKEKDAQIKEKDAQIKEKDAQIARLLGVIEKMSGKG